MYIISVRLNTHTTKQKNKNNLKKIKKTISKV